MKILISGDSFTFGKGCSDDPSGFTPSSRCWAGLLAAEKSNLQVHNVSLAGIDNLTIAETIWDNITHDTDVVIFCGTLISRFQMRDPSSESEIIKISLIPNIKNRFIEKFNRLTDDFYRYFYCDDMAVSYTVSTIMSCYAAATLHGAKFFWSAPQAHWNRIPPVIKPLEKYQFKSTADFLNENISPYPELIAPCMHLNDLGHKKYYREVILPFFNTLF